MQSTRQKLLIHNEGEKHKIAGTDEIEKCVFHVPELCVGLGMIGKFEGITLHLEIWHGIFWGLIFGPGIFLGSVGSPRDFF